MSRHPESKSMHAAGPGEGAVVERQRPTEDQIRCLAYEKSCKRNGGPGDAVTDWLEAEHELAGQSNAAATCNH